VAAWAQDKNGGDYCDIWAKKAHFDLGSALTHAPNKMLRLVFADDSVLEDLLTSTLGQLDG
jgi:hypothetical protein